MDAISLLGVFKILGEAGILGLIILIWWLDIKTVRKVQAELMAEIQEVLRRYRDDMTEVRRMYESNASLVNDYHSVAGDLKDVIILNTQAMTTIAERLNRPRRTAKRPSNRDSFTV